LTPPQKCLTPFASLATRVLTLSVFTGLGKCLFTQSLFQTQLEKFKNKIKFLNVFFLIERLFKNPPPTTSLACDVTRHDLDTYKILGLNIGYNTHLTQKEIFSKA
jgi:hypothetical protein